MFHKQSCIVFSTKIDSKSNLMSIKTRFIKFSFRYSKKIGTRYQSLDRGGLVDPHDREFIPIREPRDRSRDRSMDRGMYLEDELYGRSARQSPNPISNYIHKLVKFQLNHVSNQF